MRIVLLLLGFLTLVLNIASFGLLKTNVSGVNEPFIKYKPSFEKIIFYSSDINETAYKEFILDHNVQNGQKSLLPFILIQFTISCLVVGISKLEAKRQLVIFGFHYFFGAIILFMATQLMVSLEGLTLVLASLILLAVNLGMKYVLTH